MRGYDVAVVSLAIDAPLKWTDNLISHHQIPGVLQSERGVARKISHDALLFLAVVRELHQHLDMSVRAAVSTSRTLLSSMSPTVPERGHVRVSLDRAGLERAVLSRLRDALESAPTPRRGRPPGRFAPDRAGR